MKWGLLALAAVLVGAGAGLGKAYANWMEGAPAPAVAPPPAAQQRAPLPCARMFRGGEVIDPKQFTGSCVDAHGGLQFVPVVDCTDGRKLLQLDAGTGASAGWGFTGSRYRAVKDGNVASDPEYGSALQACLGRPNN